MFGYSKDGPKHTLDLQLRYQENKVKVLRELAEQAKTPAARQDILQLAEAAAQSRNARRIPSEPDPNTEHDAELMRVVRKLEQPTLADGWKLIITDKVFPILGKVLLTCLACIVVGSPIYFLTYCARFGLGVAGTWGLIIMLGIDVIFIFIYASDDPAQGGQGKKIKVWGIICSSIICMLIVPIFTSWITITPSIESEQKMRNLNQENMGVVVEKKTRKVIDVIFPNKSALTSNGTFFMRAPRFLSEQLQWFNLTETSAQTAVVDTSERKVVITADLIFRPVVHKGQVLKSPMRQEKEYLEAIKANFAKLVKASFEEEKVDPAECADMIRKKLSNEIFSVDVGPAGISQTETRLKFQNLTTQNSQ